MPSRRVTAPNGMTDPGRPTLAILRGLVMLASGAIALLRPDAAAAALGVAIVLVSAIEVLIWVRGDGGHLQRSDRNRRVLRVVAGFIAGFALMASATRDIQGEALILGAALVAFALLDVWGAWRASKPGDRSWRLARAALAFAVAAVLFVIPSTAYSIVILLGAMAWITVGAVTLAAALDPRVGVDESGHQTSGLSDLVTTWLRHRDIGPDHRASIIDSYSYETDVRGKLSRFSILLCLAATIAAAGLVANSVASIIGAMIVAPLMIPIIGIAIGIVTGSPARVLRSLRVVIGGIVATILIGVVIGAWLGNATVTQNSEIVGRTSPTLVDLVVAIAAGAAGAYAVSNAKVADSLPGVAIAISLVPPLATVGILLSYGQPADAAGAFLLFFTNFVSIVIAASVVFVLTGVAPLDELQRQAQRTQGWFISFVALGLVLIIPLAIGSQQALQDADDTAAADAAVTAWLAEAPSFEVIEVSVSGPSVLVAISGPGAPPSPDALYAALTTSLGHTPSLQLRIIPAVVLTSSPIPVTPPP